MNFLIEEYNPNNINNINYFEEKYEKNEEPLIFKKINLNNQINDLDNMKKKSVKLINNENNITVNNQKIPIHINELSINEKINDNIVEPSKNISKNEIFKKISKNNTSNKFKKNINIPNKTSNNLNELHSQELLIDTILPNNQHLEYKKENIIEPFKKIKKNDFLKQSLNIIKNNKSEPKIDISNIYEKNDIIEKENFNEEKQNISNKKNLHNFRKIQNKKSNFFQRNTKKLNVYIDLSKINIDDYLLYNIINTNQLKEIIKNINILPIIQPIQPIQSIQPIPQNNAQENTQENKKENIENKYNNLKSNINHMKKYISNSNPQLKSNPMKMYIPPLNNNIIKKSAEEIYIDKFVEEMNIKKQNKMLEKEKKENEKRKIFENPNIKIIQIDKLDEIKKNIILNKKNKILNKLKKSNN